MTRRATIKRAKVRRGRFLGTADAWLSPYGLRRLRGVPMLGGLTKRQCRLYRKLLSEHLHTNLLHLMETAGPIQYNEAGRNLIMERVWASILPNVMVEVVGEDRASRSVKISITSAPSIGMGLLLAPKEMAECGAVTLYPFDAIEPSAEEKAAADAFFANADDWAGPMPDDLKAHLVADDKIRNNILTPPR